MDLPNLIRNILEKGYLMSLGVADSGGVWVADVLYVHDNAFTLYWLSDVSVRHSKAIEQNPPVAASISLVTSPNDKEVGLQIMGKAEKVTGDIFDLAVKQCKKRGKPAPQAEGDILGPGESWYALHPSKIEIIHVPLFGWSKKELTL
jgi:uncharacterized protein YhbP (UPF0306 family)